MAEEPVFDTFDDDFIEPKNEKTNLEVIGEVNEEFSRSTRTVMRRQSSTKDPSPERSIKMKLTPTHFDILKVVGKGAYGRVLLVREKSTARLFAMKVLQKGHVIHTKNVRYVKEERNILSKADHPFVVKFICAFQTMDKLYLVMEYIAGGELFSRLRNEGLFVEVDAKFYVGEIILAVEYLHSNGIIHRDMKPENVLLDKTGHIRITDFGLAKVHDGKSDVKTICGTDLYMAPEMLSGNGYGKAVDYWSVGAILYEMLTGDPPFYAKGSRKLYSLIMSKKPRFHSWMSQDVVNLLKGLLNRNVVQRLGTTVTTMFKVGGVAELKNQAFFNDLDWHLLLDQKIAPPFVPVVANLEDTSNFDEIFTKMEPKDHDEENAQFDSLLETGKPDDFDGFSYTCPSYLESAMKSINIDAQKQVVAPTSPIKFAKEPTSPIMFTAATVSALGSREPSSSPLRTIVRSETVVTCLELDPQIQDDILLDTNSSKETNFNGGTTVTMQQPVLNPNASEWKPAWMK